MPYPASEYAVMFHRHRFPLLALLEQMPPEHGDFAAWNGGRTIREVVDHLYSAGESLVSTLAGGTLVKQPDSATLPEATTRLRANTQAVMDGISSLSDTDLHGEVTALGGALWPLYRVIDFHREHEVHHKGQLWMMAREIGLAPPLYLRTT